MIVYVNGDSHSGGAEAVNPHCFAKDDPLYFALGRVPHPDNLQVSYGCNIANDLGAILDCDAESASSNDRIFRTTRQYLLQSDSPPDLLIIGWSTWEREEWLHDGIYYQVTAGGSDTVPNELKTKYKEWVVAQHDSDVINKKIVDSHRRIFEFHKELENLGIPHLFFNTYSTFNHVKHLAHLGVSELDWDDSYVSPYQQNMAYYYWLKDQGFQTVNKHSYHFGAKAHRAWSDFLMENYIQKLLTT